ncbi:AMP-binding protein [Mesorhizobium atlanticum]
MHDDDIYRCTADPGWVTGTSYGILAAADQRRDCGIVVEAEFDAQTWYSTLERERISVWYSAPTAIRMMMRLGAEAAKRFDLSALRFAASVGEPLNPEAVVWGVEAFGLPFHDNWWQTETGGIMIANLAALDIKPGSMGVPLPGIEAAILRHEKGRNVEVIMEPMVEGELALRKGWPSMMRGYLNEEERYQKCFVGDWYLTGDLAKRDADGYYWFVGRADDVIKSAGHLIGPFEVESAPMEHLGCRRSRRDRQTRPHCRRNRQGICGAEARLRAFRKPCARNSWVTAASGLVPPSHRRSLTSAPTCLKTRSGKIMRRLLRSRELGLPEGDLSTLESDEK